jgi:Flp pilus assembly secretin CpaC
LPFDTRQRSHLLFRKGTRFWTAALLLAVFPAGLQAEAAGFVAPGPAAPTPPAQSEPPSSASGLVSAATAPAQNGKQAQDGKKTKATSSSDHRRAVKLYLAASKLFQKGQFEKAMRGYQQAAALDPGNAEYPLAESVARHHEVTALIESAAKDRLEGNAVASGAALSRALALDPGNAEVNQHLEEMGDEAARTQSSPLYEQGAETIGGAVELAPASGVHSFHLRGDQHQLIQKVFKAYGIETTVDKSVGATQARLDVDRVDFATAAHLVGLATNSFYVPLDAHLALVANDTVENREQFTRLDLETVYLSGLTADEMTEVVSLAKNVFNVRQATRNLTSGTITLRGPQRTLSAFNTTMSELLDGRSQVLLDVRLMQIAHAIGRNTGVQLPQTMSAFNVYTEEQSILSANQSLVQQIISSGLAAPGDTLAILGILLASGQVSSSLFSNGIALFGGGLTQSALSPGGLTANFNLNSSDSRELDQIQLRLGDGEAGTVRMGERYPIQTSSYSSLLSSTSSIPGLNAAGTSGALSSLLSSLSSSGAAIPQVEYQDLGLTLKATPKVLRNDDVALTIDMKIDGLEGTFINGNPVLNSRVYSGVVTLKQDAAVVVASEMDKSESLAISGTPGISEIPGLNDLTGNDNQKNYATLLIVMTAHVVRGTRAAGHSPMMHIEFQQPRQ